MTTPVSPSRKHDLRRRVARRLTRLVLGVPAKPTGQPLPVAGIHRILICHISLTLGNALLLTPLLEELQATWPGAEIDLITRSRTAAVLFKHHAGLRRVFTLPAHGVAHPLQLWRTLREMRRTHYDLAIDPDPQSQTGRLLLLLAHATHTLGFDSPKKSGSVTHCASVPTQVPHTGQRPVYLLRHALGHAISAPCPTPNIRLDAAELAAGQAMLQRLLGPSTQPDQRLIIGVFANATGPKRMSADWWDALLRELESARPDLQLVEIIPHTGQSLLGSRYPGYFSSDLRKLASVLGCLDGHISLDCGVMHLAWAAGAPTYGIFTTTRTEEWGPYGSGNHVIHAGHLTPAAVATEISARLGLYPR